MNSRHVSENHLHCSTINGNHLQITNIIILIKLTHCWFFFTKSISGNHLQIAKLLILHGAKLDFYSKNEMRPIDFCHYNTEMWQLLYDAARGKMPVIIERCEIPKVPAYAIPKPIPVEPAKSAKGKKGSAKKGKAGKKGKKKKGK